MQKYSMAIFDLLFSDLFKNKFVRFHVNALAAKTDAFSFEAQPLL